MGQQIIYFLDYGHSQDLIFQLGWEIRKFNYILLPMKPKDLIFHVGKHQTRFPIISFIQHKDHLLIDISFKKRFLFHAINNLNLKLIEFTSFSEVVDKYFITGKNKIKQIPLPIQIELAAEVINENFKNYFNQNLKWPGGVRGSIKQLGGI